MILNFIEKMGNLLSKDNSKSKGFLSSVNPMNCCKGSETEDSDDEPINETVLNNEKSKDQTITKPNPIEFDYKSLNAEMSVQQIRDLIESIHRLPKLQVNKPVITDPKRADDVTVLKEQVLEIPEKSETFFSKRVSEPLIHKWVHILSETDIKLLHICNQKDLIQQKLVFSDEK